MIQWKTAYIFSATHGKNSEGQVTTTYALADTLSTDVQPANLTQAQLQTYGISTLASDVKKMFCDANAYLVYGNRVLVDSTWYDIRGINPWPRHTEVLLVPVQGSVQIIFTVSGLSTSPSSGAVYGNNSMSFTVISTSLTGTSPNIAGTIKTNFPGLPMAAGTLTKTSGAGPATIIFSGYATNG
jgi:hypothetical protein